MNVRVATPSDAGAIAHVHVVTWRAAYRGQIPDTILDKLDVARRTSFWDERFRQAQGHVVVSENDSTVIGFCELIPSRDEDVDSNRTAEIAAMYVLPEHWRKGAGHALWGNALAEARRRNFSATTLWVLNSNTRARHFYEAIGFRLDGATKVEKMAGIELNEVRYRMGV